MLDAFEQARNLEEPTPVEITFPDRGALGQSRTVQNVGVVSFAVCVEGEAALAGRAVAIAPRVCRGKGWGAHAAIVEARRFGDARRCVVTEPRADPRVGGRPRHGRPEVIRIVGLSHRRALGRAHSVELRCGRQASAEGLAGRLGGGIGSGGSLEPVPCLSPRIHDRRIQLGGAGDLAGAGRAFLVHPAGLTAAAAVLHVRLGIDAAAAARGLAAGAVEGAQAVAADFTRPAGVRAITAVGDVALQVVAEATALHLTAGAGDLARAAAAAFAGATTDAAPATILGIGLGVDTQAIAAGLARRAPALACVAALSVARGAARSAVLGVRLGIDAHAVAVLLSREARRAAGARDAGSARIAGLTAGAAVGRARIQIDARPLAVGFAGGAARRASVLGANQCAVTGRVAGAAVLGIALDLDAVRAAACQTIGAGGAPACAPGGEIVQRRAQHRARGDAQKPKKGEDAAGGMDSLMTSMTSETHLVDRLPRAAASGGDPEKRQPRALQYCAHASLWKLPAEC